ncbi:MAG: class I tRNA ligase family protein [Ardenticatenales bacterium]|nr:class I tRNA ligase family protein [Ardenticatenales bacterium]
MTLGDRWLLARLARLIERTTALMEAYDYAAAKSEIELFFWHDLADNYLEMAKQRLYEQADAAAAWTLQMALLTIIKLFAPFLPFITEQIYQGLFAKSENDSIHLAQWPVLAPGWLDEAAERQGELLLAIAAAVRRYKSEQSLALGSELGTLLLSGPAEFASLPEDGAADLLSITRAQTIVWTESLPAGSPMATLDNGLQIGLASLVES